MTHGPLFIVYPARSGSTLLQIMLNQHPALAIAPEVRFATRLLKQFPDAHAPLTGPDLDALKRSVRDDDKLRAWKLPTQAFITQVQTAQSLSVRDVIDRLMAHYRDQAKPGAAIVGLKKGNLLPRHAQVAATWPDARFVFIYRDGRACAVSMVQNLARFRDHAHAARRWRARVRQGLALAATHPQRVHNLRYESLTAEPEAAMRALCAFLGLDYDPALLRHHEANANLTWVNQGAEDIHVHTREPVSEAYAQRWRDQLSSAALARVEALIRPELDALGY